MSFGRTWNQRYYTCMALMLGALGFYVVLMAFGAQSSEGSDDLSLFNVPYMVANYGRVSYPAYGIFTLMYVHPPLHYWLMGLVYGISKNIVVARGLMYVLAYAVAVLAVLRSSAPRHWKAAFVAALLFGSAYHDFHFDIRPTLCLSVYWFAGWVLIAGAKNNAWNKRDLVTGSALVGLASVMHYFVALSGLTMLAYVWYLYSKTQKDFARQKTLQLLLPASVVIVLYIVTCVLPNFSDVVGWVSGGSPHGTVWENMRNHLEFGGEGYPIGLLPPFVNALLLLLPFRSTRYLALSLLPVSVPVFLFVYQKYDYFFPEYSMQSFGIILLAERLIRRHFMVALTVYTLVNCSFYCMGKLEHSSTVHVQTADMDVARAAMKTIVGDTAVIGSRMDLWYVSGADKWYNPSPHLIFNSEVSDSAWQDCVAHFDYVAENAHQSNVTNNSRGGCWLQWYLEGKMQASAFFFHSSAFNNSELNFLLFTGSQKATPLIKGFTYDGVNGVLRAFTENCQGKDLFFLQRIHKQAAQQLMQQPPGFPIKMYPLPMPGVSFGKGNSNDANEYLLAGVGSEQAVQQIRLQLHLGNTGYGVHVTGKEVDINRLIKDWRQTEMPVKFYTGLESLAAGDDYYGTKSR